MKIVGMLPAITLLVVLWVGQDAWAGEHDGQKTGFTSIPSEIVVSARGIEHSASVERQSSFPFLSGRGILTDQVFMSRFEELPAEIFPRIQFISDQVLLFNQMGQSAEITVRVFDSSGNLVPNPELVWESGSQSLFTIEPIDSNSVLVETVGNWSGTLPISVTYAAEGISAQAAAVMAEPRPQTRMIPSSWVHAIFGDRGGLHQVVIHQNSITETIVPGDIIVSGDLAGIMVQVISSQLIDNKVHLEVEPASYAEAFEQLDLRSEGEPLSIAALVHGDEAYLTVRSLRDDVELMRTVIEPQAIRNLVECAGEFSNPDPSFIEVGMIEFVINVSPSASVLVNGGDLELMEVKTTGSLEASFDGFRFGPAIGAAFSGSCTMKMPGLRLPIPLKAILITPFVESSLNVAVDASIEASSEWLAMPRLHRGWSVEGGFRYTPDAGLEPIADYNQFSSPIQINSDLGVSAGLLIETRATAAMTTGVDFGFTVPGFGSLFTLKDFLTLSGGPYWNFSIDTPIFPGHKDYSGPNSTLGVKANADIGVTAGAFQGSLGNYLGFQISAGISWPIFDEDFVFTRTPALTGSVSCESSCSDLVAGSDSVTLTMAGDFSGSGSGAFLASRNGQSQLIELAQVAVSSGIGSTSLTLPSSLAHGTYSIYPRLCLNSAFYWWFCNVLPMASSTPIGSFSIVDDGSQQTGEITIAVRNHDQVAKQGVIVVGAGMDGLEDLPQLVTDSAGAVTFSNVPPGNYHFQAYFEGENPFDDLGELWAEQVRDVHPGLNPGLELGRNYPFADHFEIRRGSDNSIVAPGSAVVTGTPLKLRVRVQNRLPVSQTVRVRMRVDRTGDGGTDFDQFTSWQEVSANGSRYYELPFTPDQSGTYEKALWVEHSAWGKTDSWNWSPAFVGEYPVGSITVTVRDQNNNVRSNAEVVAAGLGELPDLPILTTNASGQVTFSDVRAGAYHFQAYFEGQNPFDDLGEIWAEEVRELQQGSNSGLSLNRNYPFADHFEVRRIADDSLVEPGDAVVVGTQLRLRARIVNRLSTSQSVRVRMRFDRTNVAGTDYDHFTSWQSVNANGNRYFELAFTPNQNGVYQKALWVEHSAWGKTDAWNWSPAFTVQDPVGSITVTVRDQNNNVRSNARVVAAGMDGLADLPILTTNSSGQVTFTDAPVGSYHFQAYFEGPNPFDNLGELWAEQVRQMQVGSNTGLNLTRNYPYADNFEVRRASDNTIVEPGGSVVTGTQLRLRMRVQNGLSASQSVRVRMRVDRSNVAGTDFDQFTSWQSVTASGNRYYELTFTPNQTGTYQRALWVEQSTWGKTDAWNWGPAFTVQDPVGSITVTVRDQNNNVRSNAKVVAAGMDGLSDLPVRTTNSSGQATFTNIPLGSYRFQAYFEGSNPFDNVGELWAEQVRQIHAGSNSGMSLTRNYPFADLFEVRRASDNSIVQPGSSIAAGTQLRLRVRVQNRLPTSQSVRVRMRVDRTSVSGTDFDQTTGWLSISANGNRTYELNFTPQQTGTYQKALRVEHSSWGKTDAWNWSSAFVVQPPPDNAAITNFSPATGVRRPGAALLADVTIQNTGGSTRDFWVGLSYRRPNNTWLDVPPVRVSSLAPGSTRNVWMDTSLGWGCVPSGWIGTHTAVAAVWDRNPGTSGAVKFDEVQASAYNLQHGSVTINSPSNNATVPWKPTVSGSSQGARTVRVEVLTNQWYHQFDSSTASNGSWSGTATIGGQYDSGFSAQIRAYSADCSSYSHQITVHR